MRGGTLWISEWEWDDGNLEELAAHGLDRHTVLDVADEAPRFRRNKKGRAASHQMIGPDRGGQFWTVCIVEVLDQRWRAITGWPSEERERTWYDKSGGVK